LKVAKPGGKRDQKFETKRKKEDWNRAEPQLKKKRGKKGEGDLMKKIGISEGSIQQAGKGIRELPIRNKKNETRCKEKVSGGQTLLNWKKKGS